MTHDPQLTSFGLFLQSARIEKKISIEALAAETRIRVEVLKRLEAEEHDHLPDEVFIKGFIRTYAAAVGADAEEALERYHSSRAMRNVGRVGPSARSPQPKRFWLVMLTAVGAVLLMAGLTLYGYSRLSAPHGEDATVEAPPQEASPTLEADASPSPKAEPAPTPAAEAPAAPKAATPAAPAAPRVAAVEPASPPQPSIPKQFQLDIKAIEDTWLKVIIDDQKPEEIMLKSGDSKQIEARNHFNLLIGNAGGVELQLNGSPVEVSGKSGQVVNIQLP
ncbi:MAG: DUF4115 domain-containing protein [Desulfobacterales bacterium]|nr:DUF4115 domain-containing protein [Desulfobacterales bacterium]